MKLADLLPALHELPRSDKFRAVQFLTNDLAHEERDGGLVPGAEYPLWSPYDANSAATTLTQFLRDSNGAK